jgi:hypothetical protein
LPQNEENTPADDVQDEEAPENTSPAEDEK